MSTPPSGQYQGTTDYNFAPASVRDNVLYGAARPGARQQLCYTPELKVAPEQVLEWASFLKEKGIDKVITLLTPTELATYGAPLAETLSPVYPFYANVNPNDAGAAKTILHAIEGTFTKGEKLVVACWAGEGRTGLVQAAWLVSHYGLAPEVAAREVTEFPIRFGASRKVDIAALRRFLGMPPSDRSCYQGEGDFNFSPASNRDQVLFGAARPGARQQLCYEPHLKVSKESVKEWIDFMLDQKITRVVTMLSLAELETYEVPLETTVAPHFAEYKNLHPDDSWAPDAILQTLSKAKAAGEKVVVSCWAGAGRTGRVHAAWLVHEYKLTPEAAANEVVEFSKTFRASRKVDVSAVKSFLGQPAPSRDCYQGKTQYNFAPASTRDEVLYGAARPGASQQLCYRPDLKLPASVITEWAYWAKGEGFERVITLLSPSELDTYQGSVVDVLSHQFSGHYSNIVMDRPGALQQVLAAVRTAQEAGDKILVACWAGAGRTGQVLAAWLVQQYGLTPEEAAEEVKANAVKHGANRKVDVPALEAALSAKAKCWCDCICDLTWQQGAAVAGGVVVLALAWLLRPKGSSEKKKKSS